MIDHFNLPVTDLDRSQRFYQRVLEPLGYHFLLRDGLAAGFGRDAWNFGIVATPPPLPQLHGLSHEIAISLSRGWPNVVDMPPLDRSVLTRGSSPCDRSSS